MSLAAAAMIYGASSPIAQAEEQHENEPKHTQGTESFEEVLKRLDAEGFQYFEAAQFGLALPQFERALVLRRTHLGQQHPDTITSMSYYATTLESLGRFKDAEQYFAEALRLSVEVLGNRHPDTLTRLSQAAGVLEMQGRTAEAEPMFFELLRLRAEVLGTGHPHTWISMSRYARVIGKLGKFEDAAKNHKRVWDLRKQALGERHPHTLSSQANYAATIAQLGRQAEAEPLYADVLRMRREVQGEDHPSTLTALNNYASVLEGLGRPEAAEPLYTEAMLKSIEVFGYEHPTTLLYLSNLANVLRQIGALKEARELNQAALQVLTDTLGDQHPSTISAANNYAQIMTELGNNEDAASLLAELLPISRVVHGNSHPITVSILRNRAANMVALGQTADAVPLYEEVLEQRRAELGDTHPDTLQAIADNAQLAFSSGRLGEALELARERSAGLRQRATLLADTGLRGRGAQERLRSENRLAELKFADILRANISDRPSERRALGAEAFEALQYASSGSTSRAVTEAAATRYAIERGLGSLVRERRALIRDWTATEAELVNKQAGGAVTANLRLGLRNRLDGIEAQLTVIDKQLRRDAPEYFAILDQQAVKLDEIRSVLGPDEAILMLVPTAIGTHIMLTADDLARWSWVGVDEEVIAAKVTELREGLEVKPGGGLPVFDFDLAHELYTELIAPVEDSLAAKKRIYVIADGALSRLPLGTLLAESLDSTEVAADTISEERGSVRTTMLGGGQNSAKRANDPADFQRAQWLADRFALVNMPSLQSLVFIRSFGLSDEEFTGSGYIGFGDPVLAGHSEQDGSRSAPPESIDAATMLTPNAGKALMDVASLRQLSPLPGTKRELHLVSQFLGASEANLFLGDEMTEPAIRTTDLSQTRILHLATHGLTSEESSQLGQLAEPGLVFTPPEGGSAQNDGYLAASEVVDLNLTLAEWVILSACNTAAPSGKLGETGLSGLAQAFFYAGAESLLVSHWPVFDSVAPLLTAATLKNTQDGMPKAEAFQAAMQEVRKTHPHPSAWAPFVLVGEGR